MRASIQQIKTYLQPDGISDDVLNQASSDAVIFLLGDEFREPEESESQSIKDLYNYRHRLIIGHLLYTQGLKVRLTSASVGDVSESYETFKSNKEGDSPYLFIYRQINDNDPIVLI